MDRRDFIRSGLAAGGASADWYRELIRRNELA